LIIGSQDHFLYALDMQSGQLIWKQNLGGLIPSKALVTNDAIYVGSGSGDFYRLSADTGQINWKFKTGALIHYNACADDSGIYFGSNDFTFYKLDFESNKIWDFKTTHKFGGHCAFYEDQVITSSWDHNFYGFDKSTGSVRWKVDSGTYNFGGPELIGSDVYFATHKDLYRIDAETGKLIANPKTTYLVHVVSWKDFLWTNERGFTKRRPDLSPVGSVSFTPSTGFRPVSSENCIISASGANKLVAVSEDLKIVWQYEGKDIFFASGIIHNNIYYTGNRDHKVYALQLPAN
jgi:outer membrane protein assembly factor BamB